MPPSLPPFPTSLILPSSVLRSPALSILLPITLGSIIGITTNRFSNTKQTYGTLRQPPLRPPAWVFGPVWTLLYAGMGYAAHRAFLRSSNFQPLNTLYTIQLGLNLLWMPLFFGLKKPIAAMLDITALTGCVGVLASWFGEVDTVAGALMLPYLAWLGFAGYITAGVGHLNGWDIKGALEKGKKQ